MNVRRMNLTLWTLTAVLAAAAVVCAAWGITAPVEASGGQAASARDARPATSQASPDLQLSLDAFAPVWALHLRKPLTDAPASSTPQPESANTLAAGAGGPFVLVGTIGQSLAMIRTSAGVIEVKGIGDSANGAKIVAIRPWQVDVEVNGERMTIAKAREGSGG